MEGWTKKKGGWTRVVNGTRENMTDFEWSCRPGNDLAAESEEAEATTELTRKEIQGKAKSLGIKANQTNNELLAQIAVAESK